MNRQEFSVMVASVRQRWPNAAEWQEATLGVYFRDLEGFPAADVGDAMQAYYQAGRSVPPNAGQLVGLIDKRADTKRLSSGPTPYEGASCRCWEVNFWECPAPAERHGEGYMARRREELAACRTIANAARQGREVSPVESAMHEPIMFRKAIAYNWYGCLSGYLPAGAPA